MASCQSIVQKKAIDIIILSTMPNVQIIIRKNRSKIANSWNRRVLRNQIAARGKNDIPKRITRFCCTTNKDILVVEDFKIGFVNFRKGNIRKGRNCNSIQIYFIKPSVIEIG